MQSTALSGPALKPGEGTARKTADGAAARNGPARESRNGTSGQRATSGGGGIRTRGPGLPDSGFQDQRIRPLCHPSLDLPGHDRSCAAGPAVRIAGAIRSVSPSEGPPLHCPGSFRRGGRVAEGTRLLSEYGVHAPSRVRIPPSPFVCGSPSQPTWGDRWAQGRRRTTCEPTTCRPPPAPTRGSRMPPSPPPSRRGRW